MIESLQKRALLFSVSAVTLAILLSACSGGANGTPPGDRKSGGWGKRGDLGGCRILKKKKKKYIGEEHFYNMKVIVSSVLVTPTHKHQHWVQLDLRKGSSSYTLPFPMIMNNHSRERPVG